MRRVYSYTNNATATEQQAIRMLEDDLGYKLKVIPKSQLDHYTSKYHTAVWVLCMSDSCKRMIYVTPRDRRPHYSDYQKLLASAKHRGIQILPKIKVDLDNFPSHKYTYIRHNYYIEIEIKPTSDIVLQSNNSKNPLTYTPGKLLNVQYSESNTINEYVQAWSEINIVEVDKGHVKLSLGNSITNENLSIDATVEGNTFTATVSAKPSKIALGSGWTIEGNMSLQIKGAIFPYNSNTHLETTAQRSLQPNQKTHYTSYILLGIGVTAVTLATFGVGDTILLPVLGAAAITAEN